MVAAAPCPRQLAAMVMASIRMKFMVKNYVVRGVMKYLNKSYVNFINHSRVKQTFDIILMTMILHQCSHLD